MKNKYLLKYFVIFFFISSVAKAENISWFVKHIEEINQLQKSQPKASSCGDSRCAFLEDLVSDDYFGNLSSKENAFNTCIAGVNKNAVILSANKNFWNFIGIDSEPNDNETSFASRCKSGSTEQQGHVVGKFIYLAKRLQMLEEELIQQLAVNQEILNKKPLEDLDCRRNVSFYKNSESCEKLKQSCAANNASMNTAVQSTEEALGVIKSIENLTEGKRQRYTDLVTKGIQYPAADRAIDIGDRALTAQERAEKEILEKDLHGTFLEIEAIKQQVPWVNGEIFQKQARIGDIRSAITEQLKQNEKVIKEHLAKINKFYSCLHGEVSEGCDKKEFYEFIAQTPDYELGDTLNAEQKNAIKAQQCLLTMQQSDERSKQLANAITTPLALVSGGLWLAPRIPATINGLLAIARSARGVSQLAGIAGVSSFLLNESYQNVKHACVDQKKNLEQVKSRGIAANQCYVTSQSFSNAKKDYENCLLVGGLEVIGVAAIAPGIVSRSSQIVSSLWRKVGSKLQRPVIDARGYSTATVVEAGTVRVRSYNVRDVSGKEHTVNRIEELSEVRGIERATEEMVRQEAVLKGIPEDELVIERLSNGNLSVRRWVVRNDAQMDANTGLFDATNFTGRNLLTQVIKERASHLDPSASTYYMMIDLNNLGLVNYFPDGMQAGNEYIQSVVRVIRDRLRTEGTEIHRVGRTRDVGFKLGGDEYAFILDVRAVGGKSSEEIFEIIKQRITTAVNESPQVHKTFDTVRRQFENFKAQLAKTESFYHLNDETRSIIQSSAYWQGLTASRRARIERDPKAYQGFINDFINDEAGLGVRQAAVEAIRPGVSIGTAQVSPNSTFSTLDRIADADMRRNKPKSRKAPKETFSFPLKPSP